MTKITSHIDPDSGRLGAISVSNVPFNVKRVYWVTDFVSGNMRGHHAHKTLRQLMICVRGSIDVTLDVGGVRSDYSLNPDSNPIYIPPGVWREFSSLEKEAVLLVLASEDYDESDYIREYNAYLHWFREKR